MMDPKYFHPGMATCAWYLAPPQRRYPMFGVNWAMGYLEALSFTDFVAGDDTRETFIEAAELDHLLTVYCSLHPQDDVGFGVQQLYRNRPLVPGSQEAYQQRRGDRPPLSGPGGMLV
jgi:hypothetical protein